MAKFDNLSIEDLREFIGLLTGNTYFPCLKDEEDK